MGYIQYDGPLYFSDATEDGFATSYTDGKLGGGTDSWEAIIRNIKTTKAANVVIMTDRDMERISNDAHETLQDDKVYLSTETRRRYEGQDMNNYSTTFVKGKVW